MANVKAVKKLMYLVELNFEKSEFKVIAQSHDYESLEKIRTEKDCYRNFKIVVAERWDDPTAKQWEICEECEGDDYYNPIDLYPVGLLYGTWREVWLYCQKWNDIIIYKCEPYKYNTLNLREVKILPQLSYDVSPYGELEIEEEEVE